jgi:subtilisin-like proprotein convertase family protein/Ca2+-binding RTX toxin-like protein
MPQKLLAQDISHARELLQSSGPGPMYDFLISKGYKYPILENGIAKGGAGAAEAARSYLRRVAQEEGRTLSDDELSRIRVDMATAYLEVLDQKIKDHTQITEDIGHQDAWALSQNVLRAHNLPDRAWILDPVFKIMQEEGRQHYWATVLDAAGNTPKELLLSLNTSKMMVAATGNMENQEAARKWLDIVASPAGMSAVVEALREQAKSTMGGLAEEVAAQADKEATQLIGLMNDRLNQAKKWADDRFLRATDWYRTGTDVAGQTAAQILEISTSSAYEVRQALHNVSSPGKDVRDGFVVNQPTHHIRFHNDELAKSDFLSVQLSSLAAGGIRPAAVQLDPNVKPNAYLAEFYGDGSTPNAPRHRLRNAVTLNDLSILGPSNVYFSPLLLDLSGEGVGVSGMRDAVLFDVDNSAAVRRAEWPDRDTGMLVVPDTDDTVQNSFHMVSEYYGVEKGINGESRMRWYSHGFAVLAGEDKNKDGLINQQDAIWRRLKVWIDRNHDAQVDAGELKGLDELGITEFNLHSVDSNNRMRNGNRLLASGRYTVNGVAREMLSVNLTSGAVRNQLVVSEDGATISSSDGTVSTSAYAYLGPTGKVLDAGQLSVKNVYGGPSDDTLIAAPTGSWLVGGSGSNTYHGGPGDDVFVITASDSAYNIHGNGGRDTAIIVGEQGVALDMAQAGLTMAQGGSGDDVIRSGGAAGVFIEGGSGNTTLMGGEGNDVLVGGSGKNLIVGGTGKAVIYAGPKGDLIFAADRGSIIFAGGGQDHIFGGPADDIIEVGHGNAQIDGGGGVNMVTVHGDYADYLISRETDNVQITDKVSRRDGTVTLRNVQAVNFRDILCLPLDQAYALPVDDVLSIDSAGSAFTRRASHLISMETLLANDMRIGDNEALRIEGLYDAVGGSVALTPEGNVMFNPDPGFKGVMSFKYSVASQGGNAAASARNIDRGKSEAIRAQVSLLTPGIPSDPLVSRQRYLAEGNVIPVWADYTGKGVRVGIFSPGGEFSVSPGTIDVNHPDLAPNIDPIWLRAQRNSGRLPDATDRHVTKAAGVMAAARNGVGGVGVAYDATVAAHYLPSGSHGVSALGYMARYDVADHGWALKHDFALTNINKGYFNTGEMIESMMRYAACNGRGGLGTILVASAGNARRTGGSAQGSLANNNRFVIQVGAINVNTGLSILEGQSAALSNPGASVLISAPGSGIVSADHMLETERGASFNNAYSTLTGTSLATPIVSGVVALMLQANPRLGYRDVQHILALSARRVNDPNTRWMTNGARNWNGGGMHASHDYGFGLVDARAAVRLAETWVMQSTGANEGLFLPYSVGELNNKVISAEEHVSVTLKVGSITGGRVEHVELELDAQLERLEDLTLKLISPNGTESILLEQHGLAPVGMRDATSPIADTDIQASGQFRYRFMTTHAWGEAGTGDWTLHVSNAATGAPVKLNSVVLRVFGQAPVDDDVYVYTDEYGQSTAEDARRMVLDPLVNGSMGGVHALNLAAVSSPSTINLEVGLASVGGTPLTIRNANAIKSVVTGDGDDVLIAGEDGVLLDGGRGTNTLVGGEECDYFVVRRRDDGLDTIRNFDASEETLQLVGFGGQRFEDLKLEQHGADTHVTLAATQNLVLKDTPRTELSTKHFHFRDYFESPEDFFSGDALERREGECDYLVVRRRDNGLNTVRNFDVSEQTIKLVGFGDQRFEDLKLEQHDEDTHVTLGTTQRLVLKHVPPARLGAKHFQFRDTEPPKDFSCEDDPATQEVKPGTILLKGGWEGLGLSNSVDGRTPVTLRGTIYDRDSAAENVFVVLVPPDAPYYRNAVRGFRQGDKIDLSQTRISSFDQLIIRKLEGALIVNGVGQVNGVRIITRPISSVNRTASEVYLDAVDLSQITPESFIFAGDKRAYQASSASIEPSAASPIQYHAAAGGAGDLVANKVEHLVQGMAAFGATGGTSNVVPPLQRQSVEAVLAANVAPA